MRYFSIVWIIWAFVGCVSVQKESKPETVIDNENPLHGNWVNKSYAEIIRRDLSPYKASQEAPYSNVLIRLRSTDTLLVSVINYEDSEDTPSMVFLKEGAIYSHIGNYAAGCKKCTLIPCLGECVSLRLRQNGELRSLVLNGNEYLKIPDVCPNPDEYWWHCMDYWINNMVLAGDYNLVNLSDKSETPVSILANNQLVGWQNHSTYALWNWFQQEQAAYPFDVLQFSTDDYSLDQFDLSNAFAIERHNDTLVLFSTKLNPQSWQAEKVKEEYWLIRKP